jgi:hypothetical protein
MSDETAPRRPLANRVAEHINVAGEFSEYRLQDVVAGTFRQPGELNPAEHAELLQRMVGALLISVQEIAADVDRLWEGSEGV